MQAGAAHAAIKDMSRRERWESQGRLGMIRRDRRALTKGAKPTELNQCGQAPKVHGDELTA